MFVDQRGLPLTTASEQAVIVFDSTIDSYLALKRDTGLLLKSALQADPDMVMAHCLKGYFFKLMAAGPLEARAAETQAKAETLATDSTAREQAHVAALGHWCNDNHAAACAVWDSILAEYPLDVLAMRLSHHAHFYAGDGPTMRAVVEGTLPDWGPAIPGYGFVLGMRSFACEESGDYRTAEVVGREAVKHNPDDPWAIHAVAHVMEMEDRRCEGAAWITSHEDHWLPANNFRFHLWWHRALIHLEVGDLDEVLRLYDENLWDPTSDEYLDLCNDAAILLRLEMLGVDVGGRWAPLAEKVRERTEEHILTFIDAHFAIILSAVGEMDAVQYLIKTMKAKGGYVREHVGVPLLNAILDYQHAGYERAATILNQVRDEIVLIGGSHAQRDLFEWMLIDSLIKSGNLNRAKTFLFERTLARPENAASWQRYGEVLASLGDSIGATAAEEKVTQLTTT